MIRKIKKDELKEGMKVYVKDFDGSRMPGIVWYVDKCREYALITYKDKNGYSGSRGVRVREDNYWGGNGTTDFLELQEINNWEEETQ